MFLTSIHIVFNKKKYRHNPKSIGCSENKLFNPLIVIQKEEYLVFIIDWIK
jgi:hypothetical protein